MLEITDQHTLLNMKDVATRRVKEIATIMKVLEDERNILVEVGRIIDLGLEDIKIKIAKGKIFKEPVPVMPSAEITEALGKINEQAIQEYKRQKYAQEETKESKPYLATKPATSCSVSVTPYQFNKSEEEEDAPIVNKLLPTVALGGII